ncbi:MAG: hypothetical protein GXX99_07570, partial [Clostridiales bacterium]|nr:hypothetical protein [Clostridiales bacterium]
KKCEGLQKEFEGVYDVKITPMTDTAAAIRQSTLVVTQTTTEKSFVTADLVKKGSTLITMASNEIELGVLRAADQIFVDYWKQMITNKGKGVTLLHEAGELNHEDVVEMHQLTRGLHPGRKSEDETLVCCSMGLAALDIMIANRLYKKAKEMGIGQKLKLWDNPLWV